MTLKANEVVMFQEDVDALDARVESAEAEAEALRDALEKILKAFTGQGASAVFTMANIARARR